ncbi:MAG: hypothetical protein H0S85_10210 [Desulfovibrionaceae bacterium]|jgi:hypothetical protein|nr:hypothetical protein [Desulfovibrionaceae bacterium]
MKNRMFGSALASLAVLVAVLFAGTAFAGDSELQMLCKKDMAGTPLGKIIVTVSFADGRSMNTAQMVQGCNEKYPNECAGQCWACQNKGGADVIFNTCWGPNGQCVGADCGAWK